MNATNHMENSRLLIIDDNPAIHDDFRKILVQKQALSPGFEEAEAALFSEDSGDAPSTAAAACGFRLDSAHQGVDGLDLVKQSTRDGNRYSMAFVDVRMPPGIDGVETTAKLWEIDPDLQIVICTAYSDYSWNEMLEKLGQSDRLVILKKPFDNVEVLQLATSLTRKWQLLQDSKSKMADLEEIVVTRTAQMVREQENFKAIFENSPEGIFQTSVDGRFLMANPALATMYGYPSPKALIEELTDIQTQLYVDAQRREDFRKMMERDKVVRDFESEIRCKDGSRKWIREAACRVTRLDGSLLHYQGFVVDITEQKKAQKERDLMEAQLRQTQKLESVGQLAAGIAHEINTPIQYIGDNIRFIEESFAGLGELLRECQKFADAIKANTVNPEIIASVDAAIAKADIAYLCKDVPLAVQQSLEGVSRIAHIVNAMKEFSHPAWKSKSPIDLNRAIETTITVARSEWKYVADLTTDFAADLPKVPCLAAEFNQAILNIIVNAAHAIGDVVRDVEGAKGAIKISTRQNGPWAEIKISDTGTGIPEKIRDRIFDPFFTTKDIGKGTGQGLAIARSTIVDKHGGELTFDSTVGQGTTFIIRLPISSAPAAQPERKKT